MIFELRPSKIHGVGVFAFQKIKKGTLLPLFEKGDSRFIKLDKIKECGLPKKILYKYSIEFPDGYSTAKSPHRMSVGWYLNHSSKPNAYHDAKYVYYSSRDIKKDEEIVIDYDEL
ncbi:MAG: SET domain-containing protein [Ignavibacteria bacterium]